MFKKMSALGQLRTRLTIKDSRVLLYGSHRVGRHRQELDDMADTWEQLAEARKQKLAKVENVGAWGS
jgi:hypothetical protein